MRNIQSFNAIRLCTDALHSSTGKPHKLIVSGLVYAELHRLLSLPPDVQLVELHGVPVIPTPLLHGFAFVISYIQEPPL